MTARQSVTQRHVYYSRRAAGLCVKCGINPSAKTLMCESCRVAQNLRNAAARRKLREEAFAAYGYACTCCGESQLAFLTIDHLNDDGNLHRKEVGAVMGWLKRNGWPKGYATKYFNCNIGRHINGGTCPHQL